MMLKNSLFFVLIFLYSIKFIAQTLTAANYDPVIGETFKYVARSTFTLGVGSPGTGKLWDFSSIIPSQDWGSHTIINNNNSAAFPEATFVKKDNINANYFSYFKSSSVGIEALGQGFLPSPTPYTDPLLVVPYPFSMGVQSIDSYTFFGGPGSQTLTADATGTLITCYATYTNVLRARFTNRSIAPSVIIIEDGHIWYTPDTHTELYRVRTIANNSNVSSPIAIIYDDQSRFTNFVSNKIETGEINVYPIPVESVLTIDMRNLKKEHLSLKVIDLTGCEMSLPIIGYSGSEFKLQMDKLLPGIYFLKVMVENQLLFTRKVIKS